MNLVKEIYQASFLRSEDKRYILSSGTASDHYWDKYGFLSRPDLLNALITELLEFLEPEVEVLVGLELGGVVLATALSLRSGLPLAICRKEAKNYGTQRILEGEWVNRRSCVLIEDVVTSGATLDKAGKVVEDEGGMVVGSLCVINRGLIPGIQSLFVENDFDECSR